MRAGVYALPAPTAHTLFPYIRLPPRTSESNVPESKDGLATTHIRIPQPTSSQSESRSRHTCRACPRHACPRACVVVPEGASAPVSRQMAVVDSPGLPVGSETCRENRRSHPNATQPPSPPASPLVAAAASKDAGANVCGAAPPSVLAPSAEAPPSVPKAADAEKPPSGAAAKGVALPNGSVAAPKGSEPPPPKLANASAAAAPLL